MINPKNKISITNITYRTRANKARPTEQNKDAAGAENACRVAEQVNESEPHPASLSVEAMLALLQEDAGEKRR